VALGQPHTSNVKPSQQCQVLLHQDVIFLHPVHCHLPQQVALVTNVNMQVLMTGSATSTAASCLCSSTSCRTEQSSATSSCGSATSATR
jgi:hypothetical protein